MHVSNFSTLVLPIFTPRALCSGVLQFVIVLNQREVKFLADCQSS